jgi:hypothetical protein
MKALEDLLNLYLKSPSIPLYEKGDDNWFSPLAKGS